MSSSQTSNVVKNLYLILQLEPGVDQDSIESAYRRLALRYHPDLNHSPDATLHMQEMNEAYSILRQPEKRAEYDRLLGEWHKKAVARSSSTSHASSKWQSHPIPRPQSHPSSSPAPSARPAAKVQEKILEQLVIFYLDDQPYGLTIHEVESVLMSQTITQCAGVPNFVEGVISVRNNTVPVIDLRRHLGFVHLPATRETRILLVKIDEVKMGFVVDSIENYLMIPTGTGLLSPSSILGFAPFIRGFVKVGFQLVIMLNTRELFSPGQRLTLASFYQMLHNNSNAR